MATFLHFKINASRSQNDTYAKIRREIREKYGLIHDGHAPYYAEWAVNLLPWCCQSYEESVALSVEGRWDEFAVVLSARIVEKRNKDKSAAAEAQSKDDSNFIRPADIPQFAKTLGYDNVDYRTLCKIPKFPDNGLKYRGKRKLLKSAVIRWIEKKFGSPKPTDATIARASSRSIAPESSRRRPLEEIVRFLKVSGPASPFIITFNVNQGHEDHSDDMDESTILRWCKEGRDVLYEDSDGKWSVKK